MAAKRGAVSTVVMTALLAGAGSGVAPALAQRQVDRATEAKAHYELGATAFGLGHFDRALESFERAYRLDPAPILLYNIAQAHRKLEHPTEAIAFYQKYLDAAPGAEDREAVKARIRELEGPAAAAAGASADPSAKLPAPGAARTVPSGLVVNPGEGAGAQLAVAVPERDSAALPLGGSIAPDAYARDSADPPIYHRPWFWSVVGAASLATVAAIFLLRPTDNWTCGPPECNLPTRTVE